MNAPVKAFSGPVTEPVLGSADVAVYRSKERSQRLQTYVPESFARRVLALGRFWSLLDQANDAAERASGGRDAKEAPPLKEWTESEVVKRLLEVASEAAWAEIDGGEPKSEDDWKRVAAQLMKRAKPTGR